MSLARKYDKTLRRKYSFRAVWLPGTDMKVGDILILKDGALVCIGNIGKEGIPFGEEVIAEMDSLDIKSSGIRKSIFQNDVELKPDELDASGEAELKISFNAENSYILKTSKLVGRGMVSASGIARQIAKLSHWESQKNFVVHQVYKAEDFVFLGSASKNKTLSFKGTGEAVKNFIELGSTADLVRSGTQGEYIEVCDQAGPVVLRLFRVKRNGELY